MKCEVYTFSPHFKIKIPPLGVGPVCHRFIWLAIVFSAQRAIAYLPPLLRGEPEEEALGKFPINRTGQVKTAKLGFKVFGTFAKQVL